MVIAIVQILLPLLISLLVSLILTYPLKRRRARIEISQTKPAFFIVRKFIAIKMYFIRFPVYAGKKRSNVKLASFLKKDFLLLHRIEYLVGG